jgi:ComF family protein
VFSGIVRAVRDGAVNLAYPADCHVCGELVDAWQDGVACNTCWGLSPVTVNRPISEPANNPEISCEKCGALSEARRLRPETANVNCGACQSMPFSAARTVGPYAGALEASILFLKTRPHICYRLRRLIRETCLAQQGVLGADMVLPVPLHPRRTRERGFNQAELIAKQVARALGLRIERRALRRTKYTERHRAGWDAVDRFRSVERAFSVDRGHLLSGSRVLLVDDLFTTGSTVCAATRALLDAGAQCVTVFTIARVSNRLSKARKIEQ